MKREAKIVFLVALLLIGGTAVFLGRIQSFQKLGQPGVRVVPKPVYDPQGQIVGTNTIGLPERALNFVSEPVPVDQIVLNWLPKDTTYGQRRYRAPDGFESALSVVLMGTDRTSIHKPQYCLTGAGWTIQQTEKTVIPVSQPHPYLLPVMKLTLSREFPVAGGAPVLRRGLFVYWFVADNQLSVDHLERMWWMARDMVLDGVWQRWAYVTCFSVCLPGQEEATYSRMRELITAAVPQFQLAVGARATLKGNR